MDIDLKIIAGFIAGLLAVAAIIPYVATIMRGRTRPHLFSWIIWAMLNSIAFFAQLSAGAGPGAWMTGVSAAGNLVILFFAWRCYNTLSLNRTDWVSFIAALSAVPLWLVTNEPLIATVIVTLITLAAYVPTAKKMLDDPWSENVLSSALHGLKRIFALIAIIDYNLTTVLYPASLFLANIIMIILMTFRRHSRP